MTQLRKIFCFVVLFPGCVVLSGWPTALAQTRELDISSPADEAKACVADVVDANRGINRLNCVTLASSDTLKLLGLPLQSISTGNLIGNATSSGNKAYASARPSKVLGSAAAVSEYPGTAIAFNFWDVLLKSKTTGQPKPGTLKITIVADAKARPGSEGTWFMQVGGYFCGRIVDTVIFDEDTGKVVGFAQHPCGISSGVTFGNPFPVYLDAGGASVPPLGNTSFIETFNCDTSDFCPPRERIVDNSSASFDGTITVNLPFGTGLAAVSAASAGGSSAYGVIDPIFESDDPDVTVVVDGIEDPSPTSPFAGADEIFADLKAQRFDLSFLEAHGFLPSENTTTTPVTTAVAAPSANSAGWNNTNVTVALNATDAGGPGIKAITFALSGAETGGATVPGASTSVTISAEGVTTLTYSAQDAAGTQEKPKTLVVRIDKTPPTITATRTPLPNANGWNNTNVTVSFQCSDNLSGLAPGSPPAPTTLSTEGANQSVAGTCQDIAGNSASETVNGINIDKTPPVVTASANPSTLWPPNGKMVNVTVSGTMSDNLSGVNPSSATFSVSDSYGLVQPTGDITVSANGSYSFGIALEARRDGQDKAGRLYTITVTAKDNAGNQSAASTTVVVPYDQGQ